MEEDQYPTWYKDDSHEGFQQWDEGGYEDLDYDNAMAREEQYDYHRNQQ